MQVWAKNDAMRRLLKHPTAGGFSEDIAQPGEWPDDQFTTRRLRDGDILLQAPGTQQAKAKAKTPPAEKQPVENVGAETLPAENTKT